MQWIELYAFGAVIGVLLSAALSPITFSYWHLIMVYPFAIIPILAGILRFLNNEPQVERRTVSTDTRFSRFVDRYTATRYIADVFTDNRKLRIMLVASFGYLLVLNMLASQDSFKYSYQSDYVSQVEAYLNQEQLQPKGH
ncbi:hypothetical protein JCM19240_733 [Vibrio maritimus]|uniref:Uncharacterized protein n=1 Tax=Vibrio maritimus TaxID=990268 RepID=A0A090TCG1_9VIBR|nr:hypothetical protein JCM19240_733 [Vibrio maritimus]